MSYVARGMTLGVCLSLALGWHVSRSWAAVVLVIGVVQTIIDMRRKS